MLRFTPLLFFLVFLPALSGPASARTRTVYVTDSFEITMRTQPTNEHKIVAMLRSDTPLTVLDEREGWLRVRTGDKEGWVLERYTSEETPNGVLVEQLRKKNEQLQETATLASQQAQGLESESRELKAALAASREEAARLQQEYDSLRKDADNVLALKENYLDSARKVEELSTEAERLLIENRGLRSSARLKWFLSGAGVVCFTWLIGFLMGRVQRRRRKHSLYS